VLDDLAVLDAELLIWRSLSPTAARIKDRPDKLHAAAMCAMGSTLWLFGGQQGRKHLRGLHSLNTEMLSWKLVTPAGACPPGREGHSFTSVDGQVAFLFGGQGKKLYNDLYILKQNGVEWVELKPQGKPPAARSGHSMVWDGKDSLFCFGGTTSSGSDNSLSLYSISRNEWCQPECSGTIPSPRTHHSTVLLAPNKLLVFGGCNAQGVFFNDAYVLDIDNMQWSRTQPLNTSPPPRYHHSCHVVGNKVALYGGINPKQAFDTVVLLETNFGSDLSAVAEELARMTGCPSPAAAAAAAGGLLSRTSSSATSAAGLAACGATVPAVVGDLMKLQLRDLLVKRNMEELQVSAQQKVGLAAAVESGTDGSFTAVICKSALLPGQCVLGPVGGATSAD
jgi:N-acetylneuraminic acid mutarotase